MKKLKKITNIFYRIISTAIITIGIIFAVVHLCGIRMYQVRSGSMGEIMPVGCVCFVSTYSKYDDIKTGDVISFRVDENTLVTHRAVSITENGIVTKGDANEVNDNDLVTNENYIGKTIFVFPYIKCINSIIGFVRTLRGKIIIAVAAVAFFIAGSYCMKSTDEDDTSDT